MKPQRAFIAERPLAEHCQELLARGNAAAPADLLPALAKLGDRFSRGLAAALTPLSGGNAPALRCAAPRAVAMAELTTTTAPLAANSLLAAGADGTPLLASLDAAGVLRIVDRAFGGRGHVPSPLPEEFPLSAELMIGRLETLVAGALASALGGDDVAPVQALRRDGSLAALSPFAGSEMLTVLAIAIEEPGHPAWQVTLAFPQATLLALFGSETDGPARRPSAAFPPNPSDEPFGDMPLPVSAVLVDMRMPFSTLSALQVGQILPVAVARSVPLKIGDKTIAHGTIGAVDDRVAVQISKAF